MIKLCRDNGFIFLCDFETTGFADDPKSEAIEIAYLLLNNELDVVDQYESLIKPDSKKDAGSGWKWNERELIAYEQSHRIHSETILSQGQTTHSVTSQINQRLLASNASRIELMSDNAYFDFTFAKRLGLKLHYNPIDAKAILRLAGVQRPDKVTKQHRAMNDVLNLYRSLLIAWERLRIGRGA